MIYYPALKLNYDLLNLMHFNGRPLTWKFKIYLSSNFYFFKSKAKEYLEVELLNYINNLSCPIVKNLHYPI